MNPKLLNSLQDFFNHKPITKVWVFGSYARGEQTPDSDIDLLVEYETGYRPGLFGISMLIEELEEITGKKIDLVENGYLYPRIQKEVDSEKLKIYERRSS